MVAICKETPKKNGFVLITATIVVASLIVLVLRTTSFTTTELKISDSHRIAVQTYYLAESGIAEAIWLIKNNPTWKNNFETDPNWSITYTRDPALYPNGSYQIQINNIDQAHGEIISTGYIAFGQTNSQRVVKTTVYKALGDSPISDNAHFADGNTDISGSLVNVYDGSSFTNGNLLLNFWSTLNVDNDVSATGNINEHWTSTINATNQIEGADPVLMPAISFDDLDDPDSYINQATVVYSEDDFEDLMWDNPELSLPGPITYVDGDIDIMANQELEINGLLVAEGDIEVGKNTVWCCWDWTRCGRSDITISAISDSPGVGPPGGGGPPGQRSPSGLLAKGKIDFELCLDSFNAEGLVYANDQINILSLSGDFNLIGGTISRKLTITSIWEGINITRNSDAIISTISDPTYSPVVTVEHWEEEY